MTDDSNITLSIEGKSHAILCGICKTPIAFIGEGNADAGEAGCIDCGNVDDVKEVAKLAVEYAKIEAQLMVNRLMRDTARGSKMMTFEGKTSHDKPHRFIVEFEL